MNFFCFRAFLVNYVLFYFFSVPQIPTSKKTAAHSERERLIAGLRTLERRTMKSWTVKPHNRKTAGDEINKLLPRWPLVRVMMHVTITLYQFVNLFFHVFFLSYFCFRERDSTSVYSAVREIPLRKRRVHCLKQTIGCALRCLFKVLVTRALQRWVTRSPTIWRHVQCGTIALCFHLPAEMFL